MPLEAVVFVVDNGAHCRNGDYVVSGGSRATRLEAQIECTQALVNIRRSLNIENGVGLMCARPTPTLLVSLSNGDPGRIVHALSTIKLAPAVSDPRGGDHDERDADRDDVSSAKSPWLETALRMASMALRHRQNPNQRPRIVLFVGSPLHHGRIDDDGDKDFGINEQLLRTLKKNHVSLNVVSLGTESVETNRPLLQHLVDYLNAEAPKADPSDNSTGSDSGHVKSSSLLEVPPGACLLEVCRRRPELTGSAGENVSSDYHPHDGSNGGGMDVDEDLDPELVLALKLSLEEEQQRQARLHQQQPEQSEASDLNHGSKNAGNYEGDGDRKNASNNEEGEMDDELQQAIALSLQQNADQKKH